MNKKIIITGATGLIGKRLCKQLIDGGKELTIFTSSPAKATSLIKGAKEYIYWDYKKPEEWESYISWKDAVIHLAGASIAGKRWNKKYKELILESRELSTQNMVKAIANVNPKPEVFITSSAVGYYGDAGNDILTEYSKKGNDFLSDVCGMWESEAERVESSGVRRVSIRTGIVLSADGGVLKRMLLPFKLFVGGPIGSGKQWFPWIHIDDLIKIYNFTLDNPPIKGAVNAVSPNPVTMKQFAKCLGKILHRPSFFPVPLPLLKLAIGEAAESIVASQRVVPKKLLESGFKFNYEKIEEALERTIDGLKVEY